MGIPPNHAHVERAVADDPVWFHVRRRGSTASDRARCQPPGKGSSGEAAPWNDCLRDRSSECLFYASEQHRVDFPDVGVFNATFSVMNVKTVNIAKIK